MEVAAENPNPNPLTKLQIKRDRYKVHALEVKVEQGQAAMRKWKEIRAVSQITTKTKVLQQRGAVIETVRRQVDLCAPV